MRKANNALVISTQLALRPKTLEGEVVDVEMTEAIERYGIMQGIQMVILQRAYDKIIAEFINGPYPPGVSGPVTDLDVS